MTIADMSRFYGPDYAHTPGAGGDGIGPAYGNWDAQSTTACYCDQGHFGADCSNRECGLYTHIHIGVDQLNKGATRPPKSFRDRETIRETRGGRCGRKLGNKI